MSHTPRPMISKRINRIWGNIMVPGDKSVSHRALILGSQAIGETHITGLLESEDVLNTAEALKKLGVNIYKDEASKKWVVEGVGVGGLRPSEEPLDMGNSGTAARLLMGLVAPYDFQTTFIGDESLSKRPMQRIITPLEEMGAEIVASEGGTLPITVKGSSSLSPIHYTSPIASAQLKSAILFAGLNIAGKTSVSEAQSTRDHTEKMMEYLGVDIKIEIEENENTISIVGQPELEAKDFLVPADPSSSAFMLVAGLIVPEGQICVRDVMINPLRAGFFDTLLEMGASVEYANIHDVAGETISDVVVNYSQLKAVEVPASRAPSMIDEYPILAIVAAYAQGTTIMRGLGELRVKESDRLQAVCDGLVVNGVKAWIEGDDLFVEGGKFKGGGVVKTHMDHRIAMAFLVAGLSSEMPITVDDGSFINTSFPGFRGLINAIGADIHVVN